MEQLHRRDFLKVSGLLTGGLLMNQTSFATIKTAEAPDHKALKPRRLSQGNTIGVIAPGGTIFNEEAIGEFTTKMEDMGYKVKLGKNLTAKYGYLAGTDQQRADDVNAMFADDEIDAIITMRGGWGCARIISLLDYKTIKNNPKIIMGYSDITALLIAIYAKTGLICFHGPVGLSSWNEFSIDHVNKVLTSSAPALLQQPENNKSELRTINSGKASGVLVGGNLSVLVGIIGSDYLPKWKEKILFLEDISEDVYRIDRMITQIKIAGILDQLSGIVFGKCTDCVAKEPNNSLTLDQIFDDHFKPLGIPVFSGSMIGHISDKFTMPIGVRAEIDADNGTIQMLESAVS